MKVYAVMNHCYYQSGYLMGIYKSKISAYKHCIKATSSWGLKREDIKIKQGLVTFEGSSESYEIEEVELS